MLCNLLSFVWASVVAFVARRLWLCCLDRSLGEWGAAPFEAGFFLEVSTQSSFVAALAFVFVRFTEVLERTACVKMIVDRGVASQ